MSDIQNSYLQYRKLCDYCDRFWKSVSITQEKYISCSIGCSSCCELQSVNAIEAYSIAKNLIEEDFNFLSLRSSSEKSCVFLKNHLCTIYNARPIICRTHGLLLSTMETGVVSTCPKNFTDPTFFSVIEPHNILDSELITQNLVRLNLAFCILAEDSDAASSRFLLSDIASGIFPDILRGPLGL